MNWPEFVAGRELIAQERVGRASRQARDAEDALFDANRRAFEAVNR